MQIKEPHLQLALEFGGKSLDRNLIDIEFDVEFAEALAQKEAYNKHLYRPNTYLHKWWARRCGSTFRAILKHLVQDQTRQNYYAPGGLEGQIILDPMMGGGTTLHEAIRLGANVIGVDIDPIPVLQARATLTEIPLKKLKHHFSAFVQTLSTKLAPLYRTTCPFCEISVEQRFTLYGVRRKCDCREAIFIDSYILRHNSDDSIIHICPKTYNILHDEAIVSAAGSPPNLPLREKKDQLCDCGEKYVDDLEIAYYRRYHPIAIAGQCPEHDLFFTAPHPSDLDAIAHANNQRSELAFKASDFIITPGPKSSDLVKRNIDHYLDLFSSRQLIYLTHAIEQLTELEPLVRLKLAMLISTSLEFNSMLCGYKGAAKSRPGAIRHTFAHHAYSFPYTALENNPVHPSRSSGTLRNLFQSRLVRGHKWAIKPVERLIEGRKTSKIAIAGELDVGQEYSDPSGLKEGSRRFMLKQGSSVSLDLPDNYVDHIVTDPPYFDSVQYSDLAAFFRVWLKQLLPTEVDWEYSLDEAAVDQQTNGNGQFVTVLGGIFRECHRVLKKENGRLIFTFHHWNPKGWSGLTLALKQAGFRLINQYVIHAENPTSVHIANQNALVHDVVLVLGPTSKNEAQNWSLPESIDKGSSYDFCAQCGNTLGYLLEGDLSETEIEKTWIELLQ